MATVINTHEVNDINTWKLTFDSGAENRQRAGINIHNVYREADNPNKVTVICEVKDKETAAAFIANLRPALQKIAISEPQIIMLEEIL